ncbi:MAG: hypothetical protein HZA93_16185 [Verrucomicrobia bacterium]|nr:hypothetical protein [Verrucomicrobiota bacterium]
MKNILLTALTLATTSLALAADTASSPSDFTDRELADLEFLARQLAPARLARGMTPQEVHTILGAPHAQLAPNIWAYWNFKAKDAPRADQFDAALVIFADNRVKTIKLCDGKTVRAFVAQQEAKSAKGAVAKK